MSDKGLINADQVKRLIQHLDNKSKEETIRATSAEEELRRMLGGKSIVYLSQAEYDDLSEEEKEDPTKIYFITDAENMEHVHSNKEFLDSLSQELLDTKANKSFVEQQIGDITDQLENKADKMIYTYRKKEFNTIVSTSATYPKSNYEFEGRMDFVVGRLYRIEMYNSNGDIFTFDCVSEEMTTAVGDISKGLKVSGNIMTEGQWYVDEAVDVDNTNRNYSNLVLSIMGFNTVPIAQYPMEKIVISEIEEVTTEFFELNKTITEDEKENWNNKANRSELFSKDYNDLTNKPEIPSIQGLATESEVNTLIQDYTDGKKQRYLTQEEYDALSEEEQNLDNIVYNITDIEDQYALKEEVIEMLPCYDSRVTERRTYTYTYSTSDVLIYDSLIKVSDDIYTAEEVKNFSNVNITFNHIDGTVYETRNFLTLSESDNSLNFAPDDSGDMVGAFIGKNEVTVVFKKIEDGLSAGIYFMVYPDSGYVSEFSFDHSLSGEIKVLDEKYLVNKPGRIVYSPSPDESGGIAAGEIFNSDYNNAGFFSHAEGLETKAMGKIAHAEGYGAQANGIVSHAEGFGVKANGTASHAEGHNTITNGNYSHAEGYGVQANGNYSHAEGYSTIANGQVQHVQGKFNIKDTGNKYAHIVGNGSANNESNAHTLDWDGNAWFAGKVSIGVDNKQLATEEFVNDAINNIPEGFSKDYNDLTNRPCYEEQGLITYTYDGNSDGKVTVYGGSLEYYVKISDDIDSIQYDSIEAGKVKYVTTYSDGKVEEIEAQYVEQHAGFDGEIGAISIDTAIYIVLEDNFETLILFDETTFPEKGIYVAVKDGYISYYTSSVSLPSSTVKQIDEKFIPDTIARIDDVEDFVNDAINNMSGGFSGDYNDLTNKPVIPSIEGLATEELVNNLNNDVVESINEINTELETKASTEFVNNILSGLRLVQMTQSEYDALEEKDPSTLYIII